MQRYEFKRDHRGSGGPRLSLVVTARTYEEASADFEARWEQKVNAGQGAGDRLKVRSTAEIQAEAMTPQALAVKRNARGVLK
jgi:hypothetical protein